MKLMMIFAWVIDLMQEKGVLERGVPAFSNADQIGPGIKPRPQEDRRQAWVFVTYCVGCV